MTKDEYFAGIEKNSREDGYTGVPPAEKMKGAEKIDRPFQTVSTHRFDDGAVQAPVSHARRPIVLK